MRILYVANHNCGDNDDRNGRGTPLPKVFDNRVNRGSPGPDRPNQCWLWTGRRTARGYGVLTVRGRKVKAHRLAYRLHHGAIPNGLNVLHKCDNPICVNPTHLFLGTHADNVLDMMQKGRISRGEDRPAAKLTEEIVRYARRVYRAGHPEFGARPLARRFGVSQPCMQNAISGRTWGWLP